MSKRIDSLINRIDDSKLASIDIETTGLDRHRNDINTVQLYYFNKANELKGAYIEWESLNTSEKHELLTKLKKLKFVTHNGKFDFLFLYVKTGIALDIYADTLVMAHVLGEEELNLNRIVEKYFKDFYDIPLKDKIKLSGDTLKTYAMKDAEYTLKMYKIFKHMLKKENLEYVYSYELRAYKAYYEVEKTGVPVSPRRYEIKQKLIEEINPLEEKLLGFADINFNSTKELANVMFSEKGKPLTRQKTPFYAILDKEENIIEQGFPKIKEAREVAKDIANEMGIKVKVKKVIPEEPEIYGYGLGLEVIEYTDSGAPSTGKDTLASYVGEPFVDLLTEYKKKTKLVTFIDSWEDLQVEGRIYPSFNITARTGRTTCNNPNLQQVPQDSNVRNLIEAREGYKVIECFSGDTEVLTKQGWVRFDELEHDYNEVAQYAIDTQEITFAKPLEYIFKENKETYHYEDRATSIFATPKHNMLTMYPRRSVKKVMFKDVNFGGGNTFLNSGYYRGYNAYGAKLTRFVAMYIADGSKDRLNNITFCFTKERKIERCRKLLKACGFSFNEREYYRKDGTLNYVFYIPHAEIDLLEEVLPKDKSLPWSSLDLLYTREFISESRFWDGNKNHVADRFSTTNKQTAEVFQAMCHLNGIRCHFTETKGAKENHSDIYYLNFNWENPKTFTYMKNKWKFGEPVYQDVYCVTMPLGTLVIRHNGKVSIQGNCDYSQAELRVASWVSGDKNMQDAYNRGSDLHESTLELIFGDDKIDPEQDHDGAKRQRTQAKISNFSLVYGAVPESLVRYAKGWGVNIPIDEARMLHQRFFEAYPKLLDFYDDCKRQASTYGYSITPTGRKRFFPDIFSSNWKKRSGAERQCINTPVQGMASDLCISALADVVFSKELDHSKFTVLGSVHDAILIECKDEYAEELGQKVAEIMSHPSVLTDIGLEMPVPLKGDVEIGEAWGM